MSQKSNISMEDILFVKKRVKVEPNLNNSIDDGKEDRLKEDEAVINHLGFNNYGSEKILKNRKKLN